MGSVRDVMGNRKMTVRNSEGTVQKPCQKCGDGGWELGWAVRKWGEDGAKIVPEMRGCELRFGMDSSKFGGIRCEIRVRKCCLSVNTFNLQLVTSYLIKARRV